MTDSSPHRRRQDDDSGSSEAGTGDEPLFRRDVLSGTATGAAALALGSTTASASATDEDVWFDTAQVDHPVETFHYNTSEWAGTTHAQVGLFAQYAHYDWERGEFVPHLVQNWEVGDTELVLQLREDVTWEDGEPVDAASLLTQWEVYERDGHELYDFADSVEATGDYELTIGYPEDTNAGIVEHAVLHEAADMAPQDWDDFDGEDAIDHDVPEPTASGPLVLTERTADYHQYEPRDRVAGVDDHPYAENYNWNGYRMRYRENNQEAHQSFINQELDGIHSLFATDAVIGRFPDTIEEITFPGTFGMGLWFNHDREPWSDRRVRQAVAHSLDLEAVLLSLGEDKKIHHPVQTGLAKASISDWLGSEAPSGFLEYGDDDPEALVSEAGHDIDEIDVELTVPAGWSDWVLMASHVADQLTVAGWNTDVRTLGGAYWSVRGRGDYDLLAMEHSDGPRHNHPYFSLRFKLYGNAGEPPALANYATGRDDAVTIDGETIHVQDTFEELATTPDRSTQEELVRDLALVVNRDLPYVHVAQTVQQSFVDREFWTFPEDHELLRTQWPIWALPKTDERLGDHADDVDAETPGLLKAKTEDAVDGEPGSGGSDDDPPTDPPTDEPRDDPGGGVGSDGRVGDDAGAGGGFVAVLRALLRLLG